MRFFSRGHDIVSRGHEIVVCIYHCGLTYIRKPTTVDRVYGVLYAVAMY